MVVAKLLSTIKYWIGLVGCAAAYPWLDSASGNPDPVIPQVFVVTLLSLSSIELITQVFTRYFRRAIPAFVVTISFLLGYLATDDSYIVIGTLFAIGVCFLSVFSLILDRVRRGGPFLVFLFFLMPMIVGTVVLTFPRCQQGDVALSGTDAAFTAISAVTVTGLTVIDVGTRLSTEGQWILLGLIQLGGLGTVSLFAFFALVLGHGLGIRQGRALRDSLDGLGSSQLRDLLGTICISTIFLEILGAAFLALTGELHGTIRENLFHSVSAFCNAGFTLSADSLAGWNHYQRSVMAILILLGGVGFPVIHEFKLKIFHRRYQRITVQTRLILTASVYLLIGGTILLLFSGAGSDSWFWSITCRTAGFSTSSPAALPLSATLIMMVLMAIGASPGSTGGGLKTTTVGVLFLATKAEMRASQKVVAWKRTINDAVIRTAAVLTVLASMLWLVLVTLLLSTESAMLQEGNVSFIDLGFEVTSALGTVGLSRDVTAGLTEKGRWVIEIAMILGRLGPLALVIAMASLSPHVPRGVRPHGKVMLG